MKTHPFPCPTPSYANPAQPSPTDPLPFNRRLCMPGELLGSYSPSHRELPLKYAFLAPCVFLLSLLTDFPVNHFMIRVCSCRNPSLPKGTAQEHHVELTQ